MMNINNHDSTALQIEPHNERSYGTNAINSEINEIEININGEDDNHTLSTFADVFKKISGLAIAMGFSFTFSFEVFLAVLLMQLSSESEDETAAATLVSTWMNTVCVLFMAPLFAVSVYLSGKLGAWREDEKRGHQPQENEQTVVQIWSPGATREQKKEEIETTNINSLMIAAAVTIPATILSACAQPILINVFGQSFGVARAAQKFLATYATGIPGLMTRVSLERIIFSFGKARAAMWMAIPSFIIGASLSTLLAFGAKVGSWVIPRMNQEGIALGFVVESYITAIAYGLFIAFNKELREFDFYKVSLSRIRRNFHELVSMLRLGGAITFTVAIELAYTLATAIFSGLIGTVSQSAISYCMQFIYFELIFIVSFGFSCTQEIRRALGAKKNDEAALIGKYGLLTTLIYLTPIPIFFAAYPQALEFISGGASARVAQILTGLVPVMAGGVILDSLRYNMLQQTRALNDLFIPNMIALVGMSIGIGISAGLGLGTDLSIYGVAAGYTIGIGLTAIALLFRWLFNWNQLAKGQVQDIAVSAQIEPEQAVSRGVLSNGFSFFGRQRVTQIAKPTTEAGLDDGVSLIALEEQPANHGFCRGLACQIL